MLENEPLLFRFHRGGLNESMETVTEIESFEELIMLITSSWDVQPTRITIEPYMFDERIGWDTQLVRVVLAGETANVSYPVGYLNRKPDWGVKDYE